MQYFRKFFEVHRDGPGQHHEISEMGKSVSETATAISADAPQLPLRSTARCGSLGFPLTQRKAERRSTFGCPVVSDRPSNENLAMRSAHKPSRAVGPDRSRKTTADLCRAAASWMRMEPPSFMIIGSKVVDIVEKSYSSVRGIFARRTTRHVISEQ